MANKITKRDIIGMMMNEVVISENKLYADFLKHELELLDKKSASKKATPNQEQNVELKRTIIDTLTKIGSGTVTEILQGGDFDNTITNQRISALLRQLIADEVVVKTVDKKKSYFSLA